jgi:hypothetical protein
MFASDRGFHSLAATDKFGDFEAEFVSKDIQKTYNEEFTSARQKYIWGVYDSTINSVLFAVPDESVATGYNSSLYLYNFALKSWYVWPDVECECAFMVKQADRKRVFLGTTQTRLARTSHGTNYDISVSGTNVSIPMRVRTGFLFPGGDPNAVVGFKKIGLLYNPRGTHSITLEAKIDNYATQSWAFEDTTGTDLLGSSFILGVSLLSSARVMAPYVFGMDGFGRSVQLTITQNTTDQEAEIQGLVIYYEPQGTKQEVIA